MDDYLREIQGKTAHDPYRNINFGAHHYPSAVFGSGPVIVGAGPSGLAAACLKGERVPSLIIERSNCIASLWQLKTYDRLKLHLPKEFCELPLMSFPQDFPTYPSKQQFIQYLEAYARRFEIRPVFNQSVVSAEYEKSLGLWRVRTGEGEYLSRWLIVATGENAEAVVPSIEGMEEFGGDVVHTSRYRSGGVYKGKSAVVGVGILWDFIKGNYRKKWFLFISPNCVMSCAHSTTRDAGNINFRAVHVVAQVAAHAPCRPLLVSGITAPARRHWPVGAWPSHLGPLELKNLSGKTPVLDVGTLDKIKTGDIKVRPGIQRLRQQSVEFVDGTRENFDAIILATGYKSNVPCWLKESEMFSEKDGLPKKAFPNGWKGECGYMRWGSPNAAFLGHQWMPRT
ncbi:UNVERIFIED_CONTAM: Indole-3-pyruvate monooxygenase YUCCA2 [Sesamum calycinum]|uniref:Flavin-containing monooxygenase n=1 Tax=Sesamum calycinum TaxID=2727403 RepID=A0AAW2LXD6_9LAMI